METPLSSQGKGDMVGPTGAIRRKEFVRVITESLYSLGYTKAGESLEEESGIPLYSYPVRIFRTQLLEGDWDNSVVTLNQLDIVDENILKSASFLIYEYKFFELLEKDMVSDALETLRAKITPLDINKRRVHELSRCIISAVNCPITGFSEQKKRLMFVEAMTKLLPPTFMMPNRRLEHLAEQFIRAQEKACTFFRNSLDALSLCTDCVNSKIPSWTIQAHDDVVSFLKFSNNGKYLASSSFDKSAIVWEVHEDGELTQKHRLTGHMQPVVIVAWKSDDQQLLTCGRAEVIRRWDATSGECLSIYRIPGFGITTCGWSNPEEIFSFTTDQSLTLWKIDGTMDPHRKETLNMNSQMDVTRDGNVTLLSYKRCVHIRHEQLNVDKLVRETNTVLSFSLSDDENFLLVNVPEYINLWNIDFNLWSTDLNLRSTESTFKHVRKYLGQGNTRFTASRSCFGGSEQEFIAGVSNDYQVYIWHRNTGELIQTLPEHGRCISWNPMNPHMLASADDRTIVIWELIPVN